MSDYKHPEVLVTTEWAAEHLNDPKVRFVEVDVDTSAYDQGHIAGAVGWNWQTQLQDNVRRDLIEKAALEKLLSDSGISNDTTIILYGDNNNWFAAYAFWQLKLNGHNDVRLLNGGRKKWAEEKRELTTAPAKVTPASYKVAGTDESIRAKRDAVFAVVDKKSKGQRWKRNRKDSLLMCVPSTSSPGKFLRLRDFRKRLSVQDTFPALPIFRGHKPRAKTARSSHTTN